MKDLVFFAGSYGLALALTMLHVGAPYRLIGRLLSRRRKDDEPIEGFFEILVNCAACTSFWVAVTISVALHSPSGATEYAGWRKYAAHAVDGTASCGVTWCLVVILNRLGQWETPGKES